MFDNEVLYLTSEGVCAVTASGVMDERCAQIRSAYINRWLLEENLKDCVMTACGDFLVISNRMGRLYLLDGGQVSKSAAKFSSAVSDSMSTVPMRAVSKR